MKRDYKLFLKDIISACENIQDFVKGIGYDEFVKDKKTSSAVVRQFEIIGEAAVCYIKILTAGHYSLIC